MNDPKKVFLAGVFDCFHQGHLNLIYKASKLGRLEVGIVRDSAVRKQKGENRPIYNEEFRQQLVGSLRPVYGTSFLNDFSFPIDVLREYDIILLGEDQSHFLNIKDIPFDKLYILPRTPNVSTTDIVKKLKDS